MPDPNVRLNIHLAAVTSNSDPEHYMELRVTDPSSRLGVCTIVLDGQAVMDLISNRIVGGIDGVPAWLLPTERRHALGLTAVTAVKVYDCTPPTYPGDDGSWWNATNAWAEEAQRLMGATSVDLVDKRGKLHVTFRCHVTAENAESYQAQIDGWLTAWPGPHGTNR